MTCCFHVCDGGGIGDRLEDCGWIWDWGSCGDGVGREAWMWYVVLLDPRPAGVGGVTFIAAVDELDEEP